MDPELKEISTKMKRRLVGISASFLLAISVVAGCSSSYQPLTENQISASLENFELPSALVKLTNRSDAEFRAAYSQIEGYTPRFPSVSSTCQAVGEFPRVAEYAQGGSSWKQYMPAELRGFDAIGGAHYGLSNAAGSDDFATVGLDVAVLAFTSSEQAEDLASLVRDNLEACFDFPKTSMPVTGLDLNVLSFASTLIKSDLELDGGGFRFEVEDDTHLELSKIAGILDDSILTDNKIIEVRQYGPNLVVLVATSSSKADAAFGVSAFTIGEQFPEIQEGLGHLLRDASNG